jgi:hypothetical protein
MSSTSTTPVLGWVLTALAALVAMGLVGGYVWSAINGNAALVAAVSAIIVFAGGEFFTRRRAAQQYRWDKVADQYEGFIRGPRLRPCRP